jgi:hypothetical protein
MSAAGVSCRHQPPTPARRAGSDAAAVAAGPGVVSLPQQSSRRGAGRLGLSGWEHRRWPCPGRSRGGHGDRAADPGDALANAISPRPLPLSLRAGSGEELRTGVGPYRERGKPYDGPQQPDLGSAARDACFPGRGGSGPCSGFRRGRELPAGWQVPVFRRPLVCLQRREGSSCCSAGLDAASTARSAAGPIRSGR